MRTQRMRTTLPDQAREQSAATPFLPPEGWTRSPRKSTSRFAFEMSRTTNWYRNDGQGTGYFAPGWNSERIAKRAGILRWVGLGLAVLVLVFPAVFLLAQYAEHFRYNHLKSQGVVTSAVVQSVEVEKFVEHRRKTAAKYVTETTAVVAYPVNGQMAEAQIKDRDQEQSNLTSSAQHPPPAWKSGDTVQGYADPKNPGDFAVIDRIKEADSDSLPRGAILTLCFTALFLALPVVLIIAGSRNVKRARQL